jgi:hypothetical protein
MPIFQLKQIIVGPKVISGSYFSRITQNSLEKRTHYLVSLLGDTVYTLCLPLPVHLARFTVSAHRFKPPVCLHCFALSSTNQPESIFVSLPTCLQLSHSAASQPAQHFILSFVRCTVNTKTRFVQADRGGHFIT